MKKGNIVLTEKELHNIINGSVKRVLNEMNGQYFDNYSLFLNKLNELDELNSTLIGDDDLNDLIHEMRQIINSKIGVKTNLGQGND